MVTVQKILAGLTSKKLQASDAIERLIVRVYPKLYDDASLGLVSTVLEKEPYVIILDRQGKSFVLSEFY